MVDGVELDFHEGPFRSKPFHDMILRSAQIIPSDHGCSVPHRQLWTAPLGPGWFDCRFLVTRVATCLSCVPERLHGHGQDTHTLLLGQVACWVIHDVQNFCRQFVVANPGLELPRGHPGVLILIKPDSLLPFLSLLDAFAEEGAQKGHIC